MKMKISYVISIVFLMAACGNSSKDITAKFYNDLDKARNQKKKELTQYFAIIQQTLELITEDGPLIDSFNMLSKIYSAIKNNGSAPQIGKSYEEIEKTILDSYFERFMMFNDLLFINLEGDVFYTLRKQEPIMQNLFSGAEIETNLSKSLQANPLSVAVDFDFMTIDEPSAFFIYPVIFATKHVGWCAFRFESTKLDTLFSVDQDLGQTGEVFLVNKQNYMLTNSQFSPELSALRLHLSEENISSKFAEGKGHKEIVDYRGYEAITSFEVCSIFNLYWLLIAKIDVAEVLTEEYRSNKDDYYAAIRSKVVQRQNIYLEVSPGLVRTTEVGLDQFKRIAKEGTLYTHGVSTCTSMLITLPQQFSYLAHISAYDAIYGGSYTDIARNMLYRIREYEIPDYLLRELKVYIITPRIRFTENVLDLLIEEGLLLSQIYLVKNHKAEYANIFHDLNADETFVEWKLQDAIITRIEDLEHVPSVGSIMQEIKKTASQTHP